MLPIGRLSSAIGADDMVGFAQGRLGLWSRWITSLPTFATAPFPIGMVPYPKGVAKQARYATDLGIWGLAINRQTPHMEAAWRFVSFVAGPQGAELYGALPGAVPTRAARIKWLPENLTNPQVFNDLLMAGDIRIIAKNRGDLENVIGEELGKVWSNQAAPATAAEAISRRVAGLLKR